MHLIDDKPFTVTSGGEYEVLTWEPGKGYVHTTAGKDDPVKTAEIIPVRGMHYKLPVLGFRFGNIAYCTDMNNIPEEEFSMLEGLDHFIINCVKYGRHISHYSLEEAVAVAQKVGAKHSWLTHLSHQLPSYNELAAELPEGILPAYDGLILEQRFVHAWERRNDHP